MYYKHSSLLLKTAFLCVLFLFVTDALAVKTGKMKDPRDGKVYKTMTIGDQEWMAENLNFKIWHSGCFSDSKKECKEKGRLYTWDAALKACPTGWHLPSKEEFETLTQNLGAYKDEKSSRYRIPFSTTTNDFMGPATGRRYKNECLGSTSGRDFDNCKGYYMIGEVNGGQGLYFWASTSRYENLYAYSLAVSIIYSDYDGDYFGFHIKDENIIENGLAVRCVSNSSSPIKITDENTFKDSRDNKTYKSVTIGNQTWMAENLNYQAPNSYCYNDDDRNCNAYGRLYTWESATSACPAGWSLPSNSDYEILKTHLKNNNMSSHDLLSAQGWHNVDRDMKDSLSFGALPSGYRDEDGQYKEVKELGLFWTSYSENDSLADLFSVSQPGFYGRKDHALSVRCIKGEASAPRIFTPVKHSTFSFKDSRDGKTYKAVTIGNQSWMAEDLDYETEHSSKDDWSNRRIYDHDDFESHLAEENKKACPIGWRIPKKDEFDTLISYVENNDTRIHLSQIYANKKYIDPFPKGTNYRRWQELYCVEYRAKCAYPLNDIPYYDFGKFDYPLPEGSFGTNFWVDTDSNLVLKITNRKNESFTIKYETGKGGIRCIKDNNFNENSITNTSQNEESTIANTETNSASNQLSSTKQLDSKQEKAETATEKIKNEDSSNKEPSRIHWVPISLSAGVAIAGGVMAYVFNKKAKDELEVAPMTAEEYNKGHDNVSKNQNLRNISLGVMAAGLVAIGITFLF